MFVSESSPQTHSAAGIEGTQLESAGILCDVAAENGSRVTSDGDEVSLTVDLDLLELNRQGSRLVVDQNLLILDFNLVGSIGEDDGFLDAIARRLFKVDSNGKVHVEEVTGKQVLAAGTAQIERFLVEGDQTLGSDQGSISYIDSKQMR